MSWMREAGYRRASAAEVDFLRADRARSAARRGLVVPVQVRVRDHLIRRRSAPLRLVARRVGIANKCGIVAPNERTVKRRADTGIGLGSDHHEPPDAKVRQHGFECGAFKRIAIVLFDERFSLTG